MPLPNPSHAHPDPYLPYLVRRVEVLRGVMRFESECAPAFDYARSEHTARVASVGDSSTKQAHFNCANHINLDLRYTVGCSSGASSDSLPSVHLFTRDARNRGFLGDAVVADFTLSEGQVVTFVLSQRAVERETAKADAQDKDGHKDTLKSTATRSIEKSQPPPMQRSVSTSSDSALFQTFDPYGELGGYVRNSNSNSSSEHKHGECGADKEPHAQKPLSFAYTEHLLDSTTAFWLHWVSKMRYKGRWREIVLRSALTLKLLTFSPTGAIIAAPTFSLPEDLHGAGRNWWVWYDEQ